MSVMKTSEEVWAALRTRYSAPRYATLAEVRDATGLAHTRTADAIVLSLWQSDGYELLGIEIKISRSDFLQELKDVKKADAVLRYCDRFFLAVGDADIVKEGELPSGWGLLVPKGDKLVVKREAPKLEPIPITRKFLGGLMRAAEDQLGKKREIDEMIRRARHEGLTEGRKMAENDVAVADKIKKQLEDKLSMITKNLGFWINEHNSASIGAMVKAISQASKRMDLIQHYKHELDSRKYEIEHITKLVADLQALGESKMPEELKQLRT